MVVLVIVAVLVSDAARQGNANAMIDTGKRAKPISRFNCVPSQSCCVPNSTHVDYINNYYRNRYKTKSNRLQTLATRIVRAATKMFRYHLIRNYINIIQILKYTRLDRHTVGNSGKQWETVGNSGKQWETVGNSGKQWETVGNTPTLDFQCVNQ